MDQVITFDKSLQERLQNYLEIFSSDKHTSATQLKRAFSFHLEFTVDPNGWQAVWKIPRLTCEELHIAFPTLVIVYVEEIDFDELMAFVKIIAVQDDISLLDKHFVPLIQLWPTKEQDKTVVLNLVSTAKALDMYRFFYTNVFLPWDFDEDDTVDWLRTHLESRLRLYYDIKNGVIPRSAAEHIKSLLGDARKLQARREKIEVELSESEIDCEDTSDERVDLLMDINVNILQIKNEIELLENPVTRKVIINRQNQLAAKKKNNGKRQFWAVSDEAKIDDHIAFLRVLKNHHADDSFKFAPMLSYVLEIVSKGDVVVLNRAQHFIRSCNGMEDGGCLKGVYDREETIITTTNENVMLDFGGEVILENLTINATYPQCGILVRTGKTILRNCKLIGDGTSSTHQGIIVLKGSCLELENCELSGFCTAIIGNSGSKINMYKTEIYNVNYAIKIYDECTFKASECTFRNCKEYGFCLETDRTLDANDQIGNFDLLEIIPEVVVKDMNGNNNVKGNVLINQKPKITPIEDLFSNPELDPTRKRAIETSEDEGMECCDADNTVIEKPVSLEAGDTK